MTHPDKMLDSGDIGGARPPPASVFAWESGEHCISPTLAAYLDRQTDNALLTLELLTTPVRCCVPSRRSFHTLQKTDAIAFGEQSWLCCDTTLSLGPPETRLSARSCCKNSRHECRCSLSSIPSYLPSTCKLHHAGPTYLHGSAHYPSDAA